jgi:hypothetical protein
VDDFAKSNQQSAIFEVYWKLDIVLGEATLILNTLFLYSDREDFDTFIKSTVTLISLVFIAPFSLRQIPMMRGSDPVISVICV